MPIPQETIHYSTYVKKTLAEGLRLVFDNHVDSILARTKVDVEFPTDEVSYPAVIIRFFERSITNLGVGHREWLPEYDTNGDPTGNYIKYKHYYFTGDIEFAIYSLSSVDRDLLGDSIVQTLTMGDLTDYTDNLFQRIYEPDRIHSPESDDTFINLNTDEISGFGETQVQAPWLPEDVLVYQKSYRIGITGELYSLTPDAVSYGPVASVDVFPYAEDLEPVPAGLQDTAGFLDDFTTNSAPAQYINTTGTYSASGGSIALSPTPYEFTINQSYPDDFQIDVHFRWGSGNPFGIAFWLHDGVGSTAQYVLFGYDDPPLGLRYEPWTLVPDRAEALAEPIGFFNLDPTVLDGVDAWFRVTSESFGITGEIWLADPKLSFKTERILRTRYVLDQQERANPGHVIRGAWWGDTGDSIFDWTIKTPNTTEWIGELSLID